MTNANIMTIDFKVVIPRLRLGGVIQDWRTSVWENLLVSTNETQNPITYP